MPAPFFYATYAIGQFRPLIGGTMRKLVLSFAIAAFALAIGPPAVAATPSYDCAASARSDTTTPNLVAVQATDAASVVWNNREQNEQLRPERYYAALVFLGSGAMFDHRSHVDLSSPTIDYS